MLQMSGEVQRESFKALFLSNQKAIYNMAFGSTLLYAKFGVTMWKRFIYIYIFFLYLVIQILHNKIRYNFKVVKFQRSNYHIGNQMHFDVANLIGVAPKRHGELNKGDVAVSYKRVKRCGPTSHAAHFQRAWNKVPLSLHPTKEVRLRFSNLI